MLLLDEPVAGLDPKVTGDMYRLIERINREDGITIIMISHDIEAALKYATHILHIGDKIFFGTRKQFVESKSGKALMALREVEN
jgi:zinc transport system ATP-binding protein